MLKITARSQVLDLAQKYWFYKDEPHKVFNFSNENYKLEHNFCFNDTVITKPQTDNRKIPGFLSWFEVINEDNPPDKGTYDPEHIDGCPYFF